MYKPKSHNGFLEFPLSLWETLHYHLRLIFSPLGDMKSFLTQRECLKISPYLCDNERLEYSSHFTAGKSETKN